MSNPEDKSHGRAGADESGHGWQYVFEGLGDQSAIYGNGTSIIYHQHFNISLLEGKNRKMGIPPSVGQFLQKYGGPESWVQEPNDGNIFKWLTTQPNQVPLNFSQYQRNLIIQVSKGTGKWILNSEEFLEWKEASNSSRILCMRGVLGSGKTILLSLIVDYIEKQIQIEDEAACIYFFFQAEKHAVPLARIWATLLTQLLSANSSNIASALKRKFTDPFKRSAALNSSEYFDLFRAQVATVKTVYLVIDALDSCQNAPQEATLKGFLKALVDLPDNVRILFTSRDNYIGKDIGPNLELSITPREADVSAYVKNRIADDWRLKRVLSKAEHQEEIIKGITTRAISSKMFLSAKLHMDHLSKQEPSFFDLMHALTHLPDSGLGVFKALTKQIAQKMTTNKGNGNFLLTKHILLWVSHAKVDINIEQIQDSFAIQKSEGECYEDHRPAKELVMRDCTGLVKREKGTFGLIHESFKQHLLQYEIVPRDADFEIGRTCLYFLINTCKEKESSPLLQYAARYWWAHLKTKAQVFDENTGSLVMRLLTDGPSLTRAFVAMEEVEGGAFNGMTGWHAAIHFDFLSWAESLPPNIDVDARCSDGQTALHWAVRYGRQKFVELLIRKSANPNLRDQAGDTPLHKALMGPAADNVAIVKVLIERGAQLDIRNGKGVSPIETAILYGPTSIAKLMIESQDDVNAEISEDWTMLRYVFSRGQEILKMVDQGNLQKKHEGWYQLQDAVKDHVNILTELLLERGADLNRPSSENGWTPLIFAASQGDVSLIRRLLAREPGPAKVDLQDREGRSPLWWAMRYNMTSAIQLLSQHTANMSVPTDSGYSSVGSKLDPIHDVLEGDPQDIDDSITIYSNDSSLSSEMKEDYISELAKDLFDKLRSETINEDLIDQIYKVLPGLLKSFALKLGHGAPQIHRDVMFFVHKYRRQIATQFKDIYSGAAEHPVGKTGVAESDAGESSAGDISSARESGAAESGAAESRTGESGAREERPLNSQGINSEGMSLDEKMNLWDNPQEDTAVEITDSWVDEGLTQELEEDHPDRSVSRIFPYKDLLLNSPVYEWLLATLRREYFLTSSELNTLQTVRDQILKSLPSANKVSRRRPPETYKTTFVLNWDPLDFVKQQRYEGEPHEAIAMAITLTGSATDAQALNCSQYLCQTWPCTGEYIIQLIQAILRGGPDAAHSCTLPDETRLSACICDSTVRVDAFGTGYSIAEVGEQLAWVTAALSHPIYGDGVSACTPIIDRIDVDNLTDLSIEGFSSYKLNIEISCKVQERRQGDSWSNGQCWHELFRNPVVVTGYPIPRRPESGTGLDIPLHMMAGLAQAKRVNSFDGKLFIKGFSTMLIPTKHEENTIVWHLVYRQDGSRISYLENTNLHTKEVGIFDLEATRHILGWCSEAIYFAGAANAKYDVKPSMLQSHPGSCTPPKLLYRGRLVTGPRFCVGVKDTPVRLSKGGYGEKLRWIHDRMVLLWDEEDKRGWIVNGTSALLHIVRSCLDNESLGECNSKFLFKSALLKEAQETHKSNSAIKVLEQDENRKLILYKESDNVIRLDDRIEEFFNIFETLIDYQDQVNFEHESKRNRKHLEGWDFNDLARRRDAIYPRVTRIHPAGKGWVDFTKSICAVTLFGCGFGEILQPINQSPCAQWNVLPKGKYYLAASSYDIKSIMSIRGKGDLDLGKSPINLNRNTIWHNQDKPFDPCPCTGKDQDYHSDFIQTLLPSKYRSRVHPGNIPLQLKIDGAVIFGHSSSSKWCWRDEGDPEERELSSSEEPDSEFYDSGIGSGVQSSTSQTNRYIPTSNSPATPTKDSVESSRDQYTVGILCALPEELMAVLILLDSRYKCPEIPERDDHYYHVGRMGKHNVVALCLPSGNYGTAYAAIAVSDMKRSFENIAFCLLIGIGGGVPSSRNDIRLGDVVVSHPTGDHSGVIQYDFEKVLLRGEFKRIGSLQRPPDFLLAAISYLRADPDFSPDCLLKDIAHIGKRNPSYRYPGLSHDRLFAAECEHDSDHDTCSKCTGPIIERNKRQILDEVSAEHQAPAIHYGIIASGNRVIKNAQVRDAISKKYDVICFEMEAAGVMNNIPCLVIRGICDYADSHKNDVWQKYAAAAAAAYAKLLLSVVRTRTKR